MLFNMPDARRTHSHTFMLRSKVCGTVVMTSMSLARVVRAHQSVGTILHTFAVWICMRLCKLCRQRCDTHAAGAVAKVMVLSWDNYRTTKKTFDQLGRLHSQRNIVHSSTSNDQSHKRPTTQRASDGLSKIRAALHGVRRKGLQHPDYVGNYPQGLRW